MTPTAAMFDRALRTAGIPILGVSIGADAIRATWRVDYDAVATAQHRIDGEALRLSFDPVAPAVVTSDITTQATMTSRQKDILSTIAWAIRFKDPTAWNALTLNQKMAAVNAEASNWATLRAFAETNL